MAIAGSKSSAKVISKAFGIAENKAAYFLKVEVDWKQSTFFNSQFLYLISDDLDPPTEL
jgi:hypothetical protein